MMSLNWFFFSIRRKYGPVGAEKIEKQDEESQEEGRTGETESAASTSQVTYKRT
jgi:hypothetical protein